MKTIYKYPFDIDDTVEIMMPKGAQVLSVQTQNNQPCIWAVVNPNASSQLRTFEIIGTGNPMPERKRTYIGTFQLSGGAVVFHLFEI